MKNMPACDRSLLSASVRAVLLASTAGGLFAPAAAVAQAAGETAEEGQAQASPPEPLIEIVVTGQRIALETAAELKRASDTVADVLVLDEASKVPSTSLLEILERAPGVNMNRIRAGSEGSPDGFSFEGSGIQVRGLSGTKTLLNGREVYSANGGSGLSFADIGPELLSAVTVYKASRADLIEGGVAGTIDLRTHMPFDFDGTEVHGAVSASYGDFSASTTPSASVMGSTRFDTGAGEWGVLLDVAYSKIESYDSNILIRPYFPTEHNGEAVYAPGGFSATNDQFERIRKGLYAAVQWQPTPELGFYHTTFVSDRESNRDTQLIALDQPAVGVTDDSAFDDGVFARGAITNRTAPGSGIAVASNASFTPGRSKTSDFSQGFNYSLGRWDVSGGYQYVEVGSRSSKYGLGVGAPGVIQTNMDLGGARPDISFQAPFEPDPTTTGLSNFVWLTQESKGHSHAGQLDVSYDLGDGFFRKAAIGGRIAKRQESDSFVGTWWSATARGWNGVPRPFVANAPEGDFRLEEFSNFFKGDLDAPASVYVPDPSALRANQFERVLNTYGACAPDLMFQCGNPTQSNYLYGNPPDPTFGLQPSFSTTKPQTLSAFALLGFGNDSDSPFLNFSGNAGLRWVRYKVESEGNFVFNGDTTFFQSLEDAVTSLEMIGGIENLEAWQAANPGAALPLTLRSVSISSNRTGSFSRDYFLPSFNVKFEPSDGLIFRYALTRTLTPPRYADVRAQGSASVSTTENPLGSGGLPAIFAGYDFVSGNPTLEPEISLNHDISVEWYPQAGTSMHVSLFHKTIKNKILFNDFEAAASEFFNPEDLPASLPAEAGDARFVDGPVIGNGNVNATGDTIIRGAELGGRTYFDMLPGLLRGFGVDANLTYIDGKSPDALALDMNGNSLAVPLIGLSKWSYSTTLLYDLNRFSARLAWNWRDRYLTTTSDASTSGSYTDPRSGELVNFGLPVYAAAAGRLDGSISYQLTGSSSIKLNVQNITNADQETEMVILPGRFVKRGIFVTDRRFSLHWGFDF